MGAPLAPQAAKVRGVERRSGVPDHFAFEMLRRWRAGSDALIISGGHLQVSLTSAGIARFQRCHALFFRAATEIFCIRFHIRPRSTGEPPCPRPISRRMAAIAGKRLKAPQLKL